MKSLPLSSSLTLLVLLITSTYAMAIDAPYSAQRPIVDAQANEPSWQKAAWHYIDKAIIGDVPHPLDFSGRYKVLWHESALFLFVEIIDDIFSDQTVNPLENYWNDDCLEIFVDEDKSGGEHFNNFNAFAYHVSLSGDVVDIIGENQGKGGKAALFDKHIISERRYVNPNKMLWELEVKVYADDYRYGDSFYSPPVLRKDKTLGFMLSYCDNDGSFKRESFIGSIDIPPQNGTKNLGYITADVFDELRLTE